jgi:hypothetical protein
MACSVVSWMTALALVLGSIIGDWGGELLGRVSEAVRRYDMWSGGWVQPWRAALGFGARGRRGMVVSVGFNHVGHERKSTGSGREAHPPKCSTCCSSGGRSGLGWCGLGGRRKDVGQLVDGVHLSIAYGGEWGCRSRVADGPAEVDGCSNGSIRRGELRHVAVMWKTLHSVGDAFR